MSNESSKPQSPKIARHYCAAIVRTDPIRRTRTAEMIGQFTDAPDRAVETAEHMARWFPDAEYCAVQVDVLLH